MILRGLVNAAAVYCMCDESSGIPQSHESAMTVFRLPPTILVNRIAAIAISSRLAASAVVESDAVPSGVTMLPCWSSDKDVPVTAKTAGETRLMGIRGNTPNRTHKNAPNNIPAIIHLDDSPAPVA